MLSHGLEVAVWVDRTGMWMGRVLETFLVIEYEIGLKVRRAEGRECN